MIPGVKVISVVNSLRKIARSLEALTAPPGERSEDIHGVGAVIKDDQGRILMQDHVKGGFWTIPIGKAKINQTPEDAVDMEVWEETGLIIDAKHLISRTPDRVKVYGEMVDITVSIYAVDRYHGTLVNKEPEKHREMKFMSISDIRALSSLSNNTKLFLDLSEKEGYQ